MSLPVYLDYCATTPVDEQVLNAMLPYFNVQFGNASSKLHGYGWLANDAVVLARQQVAELINAKEEEIVFTSGATESINLAIRSTYDIYGSKGNHIITVATEHNAVLDTCKYLQKKGADVTYLPVDKNGNIDLEVLEAAIRPSTILIAVMAANNETGVLHDIRGIGKIAKEKKVLFLCDAVQAAGKIPVDVHEWQVDFLALSAHKFYGPKGVGVLYVRSRQPRVSVQAQVTGGGQESGRRSGTLNVPGIVGMGHAAMLARTDLKVESSRLKSSIDKIWHALKAYTCVTMNGELANRLPNVMNICFTNEMNSGFISQLSNDIAISTGSACSTGKTDPSHVLLAMGISKENALKSIRISIGRQTTDEDIDKAIKTFYKVIKPV